MSSSKKTNRHKSSDNSYWLYGKHPVIAALNNPKRKVFEIVTSAKNEDLLSKNNPKNIRPRIARNDEIANLVAQDDAVHQGLIARVGELEQASLHDLIARTSSSKHSTVIILDQITDPQNVGSIVRSAAAFGAEAIVMTRHNSSTENATLAKASSGLVEKMDLISVTNLKSAIDNLKQAGFWVVGMDGDSDQMLESAKDFDKTALIMGAEGKGIRRLILENCDVKVKIPMQTGVESLNVSNAAAIALYVIGQANG